MPGLHVQLDVEYANDPKMIDAGPMAELLYVRALCFAKRTMRDGKIARPQLPAIALGIPSATKHAQRLVDVDAWRTTPDGWQITAWLKRNKSADRIVHDSAARRLKSLMGNHERWHVKADKFDPTCELCNPHGDPYKDPRKDPAPDSTEAEAEEQEEPESEAEAQPEAETEAEAQSSSSERGSHLTLIPGDDDDDFLAAIALVVDAKVRDKHPNDPKAYRATTRKNTITEDGELIRRMLNDGDAPETVALFVLGHGIAAGAERTQAPRIPWCDTTCTTCNGDAFIDTGAGLAPCPDRRALA